MYEMKAKPNLGYVEVSLSYIQDILYLTYLKPNIT